MKAGSNLYDSFPDSVHYRNLFFGPRLCVRETGAKFLSFNWSERHLQCAWFDMKWPEGSLKTSDMEDVIVESPGKWNLEAGPDFLDASLKVGSEKRRLQGDVEVHIRPEDWTEHGHADNPAYAGVVAHVTFFPSSSKPQGLPPGAVCISLADALRKNPSFSFDSIDISAYPMSRNPNPSAICFNILKKHSLRHTLEILEAAGQERLRRKAEAIASEIEHNGAGQALYQRIATALGYKRNSLQFRELARTVTIDKLQSESDGNIETAYALLMGVSGLIPNDHAAFWDRETRDFMRNLWDKWWKMRGRWQKYAIKADNWKLSGLRPANHPVRRIAALAALFADNRFADWVYESESAPASKLPGMMVEKLVESARFEYWNKRSSFGGKLGTRNIALIGKDRAKDIAVNVLLPFLAARGANISGALKTLPPDHGNALTRSMANLIVGTDNAPACVSNTLLSQGLIQISEDFCMAARRLCKECRFPSVLEDFAK